MSLFGNTTILNNIVDCVPRVHHVCRKRNTIDKENIMMTDDLHIPVTSVHSALVQYMHEHNLCKSVIYMNITNTKHNNVLCCPGERDREEGFYADLEPTAGQADQAWSDIL